MQDYFDNIPEDLSSLKELTAVHFHATILKNKLRKDLGQIIIMLSLK